jgi:hypothetical protein
MHIKCVLKYYFYIFIGINLNSNSYEKSLFSIEHLVNVIYWA